MLRAILFVVLLFSLSLPTFADDQPATGSTTQPDADAISADLNKALDDLHTVSVPMPQLFSADGRKQAAPKMIPALKHVLDLLQQLAATSDDAAAQVADTIPQIRVRLLILGDPDTVAQMQAQAAGKDAVAADEARAELAVAEFFDAHGDAAGQIKALDDYAAAFTDKANPSVSAWLGVIAEIDPASPGVSDHLVKVIKDNIPEPDADQIIMQITDSQKLAGLLNKPLVLTGTTLDGKPFSTADWKGKVILVDFWATWCQGCVDELPHVKQLYNEYHTQGFEIVGVNNDFAAADVTKFMADNPIPWPHLFDPTDAAKQDWNSVTHNLGVDALPEMIIIDRDGIVRSVQGVTDADTMVPKLLAESAAK
jgi:thiol-disulfide isomerase/thioredoxin